MAEIWKAPREIQDLVRGIRLEHHKRLHAAALWLLCTDAPAISKNRVVTTHTSLCTKFERLATDCDFRVVFNVEAWAKWTDLQREVVVDEALCRCGVKHVPQTLEVNGRKEAVKDDLGRTIYTDEIEYGRDGKPKWKLNPPDAALFYALIHRHSIEYCEGGENVQRVAAGKPIQSPEPSLFDFAEPHPGS